MLARLQLDSYAKCYFDIHLRDTQILSYLWLLFIPSLELDSS